MKKLNNLSLLLSGIAFFTLLYGCSNSTIEEEAVTPEERPMTETETRVQNMINAYSDYDPASVEALLSNKLLILDAYLEYDSRWDRIVAEPYAFGVKNDPEFTPDRYLLREDGTAVHYTLEEGVWVTTEGTWSFDAASQTLRLPDQEEHIVALTPSSIIWDKETTNVPGGKPRFYRIIYKVSDYDPNQPNPTPDTVYEPIEVKILTLEQFIRNEDMSVDLEANYVLSCYNPYTNSYDLGTYILIYFPENELSKTLSGTIYYKIIADDPSQFYIYWGWVNANGWQKEEELGRGMCINEYAGYLYNVDSAVLTPTFGIQKFKLHIYHLDSNRYFSTEQYQFVLLKNEPCYIEKL